MQNWVSSLCISIVLIFIVGWFFYLSGKKDLGVWICGDFWVAFSYKRRERLYKCHISKKDQVIWAQENSNFSVLQRNVIAFLKKENVAFFDKM